MLYTVEVNGKYRTVLISPERDGVMVEVFVLSDDRGPSIDAEPIMTVHLSAQELVNKALGMA